jgi:predicted phosphoribosyltransferase
MQRMYLGLLIVGSLGSPASTEDGLGVVVEDSPWVREHEVTLVTDGAHGAALELS